MKRKFICICNHKSSPSTSKKPSLAQWYYMHCWFGTIGVWTFTWNNGKGSHVPPSLVSCANPCILCMYPSSIRPVCNYSRIVIIMEATKHTSSNVNITQSTLQSTHLIFLQDMVIFNCASTIVLAWTRAWLNFDPIQKEETKFRNQNNYYEAEQLL